MTLYPGELRFIARSVWRGPRGSHARLSLQALAVAGSAALGIGLGMLLGSTGADAPASAAAAAGLVAGPQPNAVYDAIMQRIDLPGLGLNCLSQSAGDASQRCVRVTAASLQLRGN